MDPGSIILIIVTIVLLVGVFAAVFLYFRRCEQRSKWVNPTTDVDVEEMLYESHGPVWVQAYKEANAGLFYPTNPKAQAMLKDPVWKNLNTKFAKNREEYQSVYGQKAPEHW